MKINDEWKVVCEFPIAMTGHIWTIIIGRWHQLLEGNWKSIFRSPGQPQMPVYMFDQIRCNGLGGSPWKPHVFFFGRITISVNVLRILSIIHSLLYIIYNLWSYRYAQCKFFRIFQRIELRINIWSAPMHCDCIGDFPGKV